MRPKETQGQLVRQYNFWKNNPNSALFHEIGPHTALLQKSFTGFGVLFKISVISSDRLF